ncbi:hypothetical protein GAO09_11130 [Rhizobiales bacterium RZME27]|uniref:Uncharacterized protein n=1 Tax=Endobacterium cereale TaxID=2663029 RepID=A0A6A8ABM3_9HYPH|nr:hypothetical protein [Endobacterium cereale]
MNEFIDGRRAPCSPDVFVVGVRIELANLIQIHEFACYFGKDHDPVLDDRDRTIGRRQVPAGHGKSLLATFRGSTLRLRFLLSSLPGLGTFSSLFRLASFCSFLDNLPSVLQLVVGRVWNLPNLLVTIPSREWDLPQFIYDGLRVGRADPETPVVDG